MATSLLPRPERSAFFHKLGSDAFLSTSTWLCCLLGSNHQWSPVSGQCAGGNVIMQSWSTHNGSPLGLGFSLFLRFQISQFHVVALIFWEGVGESNPNAKKEKKYIL